MLVVTGMPGVLVVAGVLVLFVVATMLGVTGVLSGAVQVVRCVGRSVIGVAQFTNALLGDLGGVIPFRVVPGVLMSLVIVTHSSSFRPRHSS
ncbi:MAG: hypothetical protein ACRDHC_03365 [Actinomycetota bacterium]